MNIRNIVTLLLSITLTASLFGEGKGPFSIASRSPDGWTIGYTYQPIGFSTVMIDGREHRLFEAQPFDATAEGEPLLPSESFSLGVPFDGSYIVTLENLEYEVIENVLVAPVPEYRITDEQEAIAEYRKQREAYSRDMFLPREPLQAGRPYILRHQRILTVRIAPYQYNALTGTLRRLVSAVIRVRLVSGVQRSFVHQAPPDPLYEPMYRTSLLNYEEARSFREMPTQVESGPDPTRDWFETGRTYYKIPIGKDGWYRVTTANIVAAGGNPLQIDPLTLRMFTRGREIPLVIRADTSIEFFARKHYGDTTYIDFYADSSVYWLTWGGQQGLRFEPTSQPDGIPSILPSAREVRHEERNTGYFTGTTTLEVIQNETIPGEGWFWERIFPNASTTKLFVLNNIDFANQPVSYLSVRLFSMTVDLTGPDHHARFWINDSLVGETMFEGRTGVTFFSPFPSTWLRNDTNRVRVMSVTTPSIPNLFYLDWFEVDHHRLLRAQNNRLVMNIPGDQTGVPKSMTVSGFTSPVIEIRDLSNGRLIQGGVVSGDSVSGFSITFQDTVSQERQYVIVAAGASDAIPSMKSRVFPDIRSNPPGADYIIITHRDFLTSAQQLAAHRAAVNGVRTRVVDIQDIYDEFNYGVTDTRVIKNFLRFAFLNWTAPAPSQLLLLGDASWDDRKYLSTSIKKNFVPSYGIPAGDNWFACFDSVNTIIPSLNIGRLPVQDSIQAARTVAKIIGYDAYTLGSWNKNFLMITGGTSPSEQSSFNSRSENTIATYIAPPPIGGSAFRVYKATSAVIDGENKQLMQDYVRDGLVFLNFLGHSGGRIWGVDIGNPNDLGNTNGRLPFVSSVSCNVGAFAEPSNNVLAEDFVLADNRGAIAAWASSSLGYPNTGTFLMNYFLSGVKDDSLRAFGILTTNARFRLYQGSPNDPVTLAMVVLNPLIGDPLSRLAIPLKSDLAVSQESIVLQSTTPTPNDSILTVKLRIDNYGLVPPDSVGVTVSDLHNGQNLILLDNKKLGPTRHRDSLLISWNGVDRVGRHLITATLDPLNVIAEVNEFNNTTTKEQYVFANLLAVVKPLENQVVPPGGQTLVVTSPLGRDSSGFQYFFELDTVDTFDSPAKISSGPVTPGIISGEWTTPPLSPEQVFFWRARTLEDTLAGTWLSSSFSTGSDVPALPRIRLREGSRKQFARDRLHQVAATDSGVTIAPNVPVNLYCRSLGYRGNLNLDYYSIIKINEQTIVGHWWVLGNSFMVVRLDEFTGSFVFREFRVSQTPSHADSMKNFIRDTPAGNYIGISVIIDGRTNVTESLYVALESLGSTMIRSVTAGRSWAFIGRKGSPSAAREQMTNDSAVVNLQIPNFYSFGSGSLTSRPIASPTAWDSIRWEHGGIGGVTSSRLAVLGVRGNGVVDTLRVLPGDSTSIAAGFLNALTSGPTYSHTLISGLLSSSDALVTPVLRKWSIDFFPAGDVAISSRSIGGGAMFAERGSVLNLPVTVYNIGYRNIDSGRVVVSMFDKFNKARPIAYDVFGGIAVGGLTTAIIPINTNNFPRHATLQVSVSPSKREKDLVAENNIAYYAVHVSGNSEAKVQIFADGVQLMDGDYVPPVPALMLRLPPSDGTTRGQRGVRLFVNGVAVVRENELGKTGQSFINTVEDELTFQPVLSQGDNLLRVELLQKNLFGEADTTVQEIMLRVQSEMRVLHVFNYPNPFRGETVFTYVLTGISPPENLTIRVFTVAGRKVKELQIPRHLLNVGVNRTYWDGRDEEGEELANGYYFYRIVLQNDGKTETATRKMAKLK